MCMCESLSDHTKCGWEPKERFEKHTGSLGATVIGGCEPPCA